MKHISSLFFGVLLISLAFILTTDFSSLLLDTEDITGGIVQRSGPAKLSRHIKKIGNMSVTSLRCIDSDGGLAFSGKGTVTIRPKDGSLTTYQDECTMRTLGKGPTQTQVPYLIEYFCDETGSVQSKQFACPGCKDGACPSPKRYVPRE